MKNVQELEAAFQVYFTEMDVCERGKCFFALLHLAVVLPDICAALQYGANATVGTRYRRWCRLHYPANPKLTPHDRYCLRCKLLHEGTTRADERECQYHTFSLVHRTSAWASLHLTVAPDHTNIVLDVQELADETRAAVRHWFASLQTNHTANAIVERNLPRLVRVQWKTTISPVMVRDEEVQVMVNGRLEPVVVEVKHFTTSST